MSNGKHKNPHYALRIPAATMDKLKYIAEYNGRSANKEIEQLILRHIAEFEKKVEAISLDGFKPRSRT
ncbi:MAG: Arc family DNA-binding protein [Clostridiales bacterium]|nr:Arc family DNA-binding protein [Clostridiales bacterium]